jgi:iron complex transport system permease protein
MTMATAHKATTPAGSAGESRSRGLLLCTVLLILLAFLFVSELAAGSVAIPFSEVVSILAGKDASRQTWETIVWDIRMPKAMTALLAGGGLAVSGLIMQTLFRNPLAGPSVLGIDAGASLGVALILLVADGQGLGGLGTLGSLGRVGAAGLGAAAVVTAILFFADRIADNVTILILGLMFGYVATAIVTVMMQYSDAEQMQQYLLWTFASFASPMQHVPVLFVFVLCGVVLAFLTAKSLNAMLLGETYARSLGVRIRQVRLVLLVSSSLLVGSITAFCGPILFLGIAVPHIARGLVRSADHRILLPATLLAGANLALLADLLTLVPGSRDNQTLPINAILSLVGAPVVAWVILRQREIRV